MGGIPESVEPDNIFAPVARAFQPRQPPQWLLQDLLPRPSLNLLVGPSGAKKTYAALDLAVSIALGQPWLGRETQQGAVLWIDEESGPNRFLDRVARVMRAHHAPTDLPFHFSSLTGFDLYDPYYLQILFDRAAHTQAALIVIDPLVYVFPRAHENAVSQLIPVFQTLQAVALRTNAALLLIHHTNKAGLYRGSSHLRNAVDLMLMVHSGSQSPYVEFHTAKTRDIAPQHFAALARFEPPGPEPQRVWLEPASLAQVRRAGSPLSPAAHHVLTYLERHGPSATKAIIASPPDCTPAQARRAIFTLLQAGIIARADQGNQGRPATYTLVE